MNNEAKTTSEETLDSIEKAGTVVTDNKSGVQCLTIIGQIEGH